MNNATTALQIYPSGLNAPLLASNSETKAIATTNYIKNALFIYAFFGLVPLEMNVLKLWSSTDSDEENKILYYKKNILIASLPLALLGAAFLVRYVKGHNLYLMCADSLADLPDLSLRDDNKIPILVKVKDGEGFKIYVYGLRDEGRCFTELDASKFTAIQFPTRAGTEIKLKRENIPSQVFEEITLKGGHLQEYNRGVQLGSQIAIAACIIASMTQVAARFVTCLWYSSDFAKPNDVVDPFQLFIVDGSGPLFAAGYFALRNYFKVGILKNPFFLICLAWNFQEILRSWFDSYVPRNLVTQTIELSVALALGVGVPLASVLIGKCRGMSKETEPCCKSIDIKKTGKKVAKINKWLVMPAWAMVSTATQVITYYAIVSSTDYVWVGAVAGVIIPALTSLAIWGIPKVYDYFFGSVPAADSQDSTTIFYTEAEVQKAAAEKKGALKIVVMDEKVVTGKAYNIEPPTVTSTPRRAKSGSGGDSPNSGSEDHSPNSSTHSSPESQSRNNSPEKYSPPVPSLFTDSVFAHSENDSKGGFAELSASPASTSAVSMYVSQSLTPESSHGAASTKQFGSTALVSSEALLSRRPSATGMDDLDLSASINASAASKGSHKSSRSCFELLNPCNWCCFFSSSSEPPPKFPVELQRAPTEMRVIV